jgi:uncharacterized protein (DUF1810 family)
VAALEEDGRAVELMLSTGRPEKPAMDDPFNLKRFVEAQSAEYEDALAELRAGQKRSHWIWFIFPQMKGLGRSSASEYYGIASLAEAEAYLRHPLLGPRLAECTAAVNRIAGRSIDEIFGFPDNLKFLSSMTLFARAAEDNRIFQTALDRYFNGEPDSKTIALL